MIESQGVSAALITSVLPIEYSIINACCKQISKGMALFVGQALRHVHPSLIRREIWITVRQILTATLSVILPLLVFPRIVSLVFLADPYGQTVDIVVRYIHGVCRLRCCLLLPILCKKPCPYPLYSATFALS